MGALVAVGATLVGVGASRRRDDERPGIAAIPDDVIVVVVPGFGSQALGTFDDLMSRVGVPPERVMAFDWRWVEPSNGHVTASKRAEVDDAADVLEAYLAGLGATGNRIYVVGHSKGGAVIAQLMTRWDADPERALPAVFGAALLDPPLSSGRLGFLQRIGRWLPFIPNNGGYDPIHCGWLTCHDSREHMGEAAGVDVLVIRNTDAAVTSFLDEPEGLRIYDLEDDGGPPAFVRIFSDGSVLGRIREAHESPLHHPAVASCLHSELHAPGTCQWTAGAVHGEGEQPATIPIPLMGAGGGLGRHVL